MATGQVALVFFQLGLEPLEQREGIGRGPGKARQHLAVVELAHLARRALDHNVAQRHLPVAADGDLDAGRRLATHAEDGGAVEHRVVVGDESIAAADGAAAHFCKPAIRRKTGKTPSRPRTGFADNPRKQETESAQPPVGRADRSVLRGTTQACSLMPITLKKIATSRCRLWNWITRPWPCCSAAQLSTEPAPRSPPGSACRRQWSAARRV